MPEKAKILVVDDDPVIVSATRRLLDKAGYETLPAQTGREALEAARAHHPDLILLDVNMPDMNGFDACRQIKADPVLSGIGVIIVTSTYTDAESQAAGLDLGADGYIARPISNRELLARVQAMLRQRAAEQEARRIAAEWTATFDAVESAVFLTDEHFTILKWNRKAETLFQTPQAEMVGQKCYRLVHGTRRPIAACPLEAVREEKQRKTMVFEQDGIWLEVTVDPVLDASGQFIGSVHVVNNITERKRAEDALNENRQYLQAVLDSINDAVFVDDADTGEIIDVNRAMCEMYGYSREEALRTPIGNLSLGEPPYSQAEALEWLRKTREFGPQVFEWLAKHKDGHTFWVEVSTRFAVIGGHNRFVVIVRDITERKQAEEALRESEEKLQNIIQHSGSMFYTHTPDHVLTYVSPQVRDILDCEPEEAHVRWQEFLTDHPTNQKGIQATERAIQTGQRQPPYELELMTRTGRRIWVRVDESPLVRNGTTVAIVGSVTDITERKRAEEALRQSEETYRNLFHNAQVGLFRTCIEDGKILESNEQLARMFGYDNREEFIAEYVTSQNYVDPGTRERMLDMIRRDGYVQNFEARFYRKDRSIFWARYSARIYPEQGWIEGVVEDITERKQAEARLLSEKAWSEAIINAAPNIIVGLGEGFQIMIFNKFTEELTGYKAEEVLGKPWIDLFIPPEQRAELYRVWEQIVENSLSEYHYENPITTKTGEQRLISWNNTVLTENGQFRMLLSIGEDITERKRAEEALRESEEKYRTLVETADDVILLTDLEGRHLFRNSAYYTSLGFEVGEDVELDGYARVHPDDAPRLRSRMEDLLREGQISSEYRVRHKNGSWIYRYAKSRLIRDANGQPQAILAVIRDITERKRVEDEIRRLNAELEQRVEERTRQLREAQEQLVRQERLAVLGQLAGSVGHELRNPLAVISNAVYFLKLIQPQADEKVREYLDILERETRNADKIINDLLDFARIKSVERAAVSVPDLARRVLERYPAPANIRLRLDLPPDLPPLHVDGRQIEQVLGNLVLNAYQAMEAEGGELSLISEQLSVNSEQWLRITVKDTGPGIPPENLPKLFEPLFTTKARGIGLGLAVSKRLAEANGGRIEVQSTSGQGAAFTLILPAVPQPPQALQTEAEQ